MFGEFVKERRIARDITQENSARQSNGMPATGARLREVFSHRPRMKRSWTHRGSARIEQGSEEWQAMKDLSPSDRKCFPMISRRTVES
jgi:transcriptional regulator with XRE-family HTH domain